ncbi:MAG: Uma2 family endonuclease [Anaerolineae bacterium]|nr:MAG: Uma2 family endonuclease [Anaerolineae bacterium]
MSIHDLTRSSILAENIDFETYLRDYAHLYAEWVDGRVFQMSTNSLHNLLVRFLIAFFDRYLEMTGEGELRHETFVMRVTPTSNGRLPDLLVVRTEHLDRLHDTLVDGPADLVIEVVSPESTQRDRGEKFTEYEAGGVQEYWILDPERQETLFYVLGEDGHYHARRLEPDGTYHSVVLPQLTIQAEILLTEPIPSVSAAVQMVDALLK